LIGNDNIKEHQMAKLALKDASEKLGLSVITLRRYIKENRLKAIKIGRTYFVEEEELNKIVDAPSRLSEAISYVDEALNDTEHFQYHVSRKDLLHKAKDIFLSAGKRDLAERANYDANIFGYTYTNIFTSNESRERWGRFAPMGSGTTAEGVEMHFPDPAWIDSKMLAHAKQRLSETSNPIVLSIYYDLLFEYSKDENKKTIIAKAIDNYIKAAEMQYKNEWNFEFLDSIIRAYEIATKTKDKALIEKTLKLLFDYISRLVKDDKPRYTFEIIEVLIKKIDTLSESQIQELIKTAELGVQEYGSRKGDNRHLERSFLELIKSIYHAKKDKEAELEVTKRIAKSFLTEAEEKSESGLVRAHFLEEGLAVLNQAGVSDAEKKKIRAEIEKAYIQSESEMKPISVEFKLTNKEVEDFVDSVLGEDKTKYLERIGSIPQLIPNYKSAEELTKKMAVKAPLQHLISKSTIQDGRKIYVSKGGLEVTEESVIQQLGQNIKLSGMFLGFVFDALFKKGVTIDDVTVYLKEKDLFQYDNFDALEEGLLNFNEQRYFSALCVLLPQLELILRETVRKLGMPTLTVSNGVQRVSYIKELLSSLRQVLGDNLYWYFSLITYDKRGLSLKDSISHGLLKKGLENKNECLYVLHLLLILSTFKLEQKNSAAA